MSQYVNSRDSIALSIAKLSKFTKSIPDTISLAELNAKINHLNDRWSKYEEYHHEVLSVTGSQEIECQQNIGLLTEDLYISTLAKFVEYKEKLEASLLESQRIENVAASNEYPVDNTEPTSVNVHLPTIKLPYFQGEYNEWIQFKDLFTSLIIDNRRLSNAQKLHYLKSSVGGEAAKLLDSYTICNDNFEVAWTALETRCENKRSLTNIHLQMIVDSPTLKAESPLELRKLVDHMEANLKQLGNLKYTVEQWDPLLTFLIMRKLDKETRRQWELQYSSNDYPTWSELSTFLYNRCRALEMVPGDLVSNHHRDDRRSRNKRRTTNSLVVDAATRNEECIICKADHRLSKCHEFKSWNTEARREFVSQNKLCFNCLKNGHRSTACRNPWSCTICKNKHHTLLHFNLPTTIPTLNNLESPASTSAHIASNANIRTVLLATAIINIPTKFGTVVQARALIDQGSQCSLITEAMVQRLSLHKQKTNVHISGIGSSLSETATSIVNFKFMSKYNTNEKYDCSALVIRKITTDQPSHSFDNCHINLLYDLQLADPSFANSGRIDILLGADIYSSIIREGLKSTNNHGIVAQNTVLGWIISGPIPRSSSNAAHVLNTFNISVEYDDINKSLRKFWELEETCPSTNIMSDEEKACEEHFDSTHRRQIDGTYIVRLPFKDSASQLGNSKHQALQRFHHLERRLQRNLQLKLEYCRFMKEYEELNHMKRSNDLSSTKEPPGASYYIPHHHILKADSSTTKLRVVFDASMSTSSGISLNETMMVGPKLQQDIISILLRWRIHKIAFTADVEKMYRQVKVHESDTNYQRILFRYSQNDPVSSYNLLTITYGTSSAPYLAVKCLQQLAIDEAHNYPLASKVTLNDFYVDDVLSGSENISDALNLQDQLLKMLKSGGFSLRKWSSNHQSLLTALPNELRETKQHLEIQSEETVKALGLTWCPSTDQFQFKVNFQHKRLEPTKRSMLSDASKFFDPIGWLAPIIVKMKLQLQHLWLTGIRWDEKLPDQLKQDWLQLQSTLNDIESIRINRWIGFESSNPYELHGFCDASKKAYAAVVFSRVKVNNKTITNLIVAKTRVAPIKTISLPRLELCGAVLLVRLLKRVESSFNRKPESITAWTDSTIVLSWLKSHPCKWKCFIANRTAEILTTLNSDQWRHVPTADNPADCATRGMFPNELEQHDLWWNGPKWLLLEPENWPSNTWQPTKTDEEAKSHIVTLKVTTQTHWQIINKVSTLEKLQRIIAYMIRFTLKTRNRIHDMQHITASEMKSSLIIIIRNVQAGMYPEYTNLTTSISVTGQLTKLNPFIDDDGLLRVGGRLQNSWLKFNQKHPIILSPNHHFTQLLIDHAHRVTLHGGPQLVLHILRQQYWIINARKAVRKFINNCMNCFRQRIKGKHQLMGQLPSARVTPSRPFSSSGVDFAGPITIKINHLRGSRTTKAYICIFVCMAVKAIHLEVVSQLTSEAFIAAYKRFVSRRGLCRHLYSDNGTNFVGANTILIKNHQRAMKNFRPEIASLLANDGTEWHFIPPYSPHFGGLWEASVKSVKGHLVRLMKDKLLGFEELTTVLTQIEAALNSRPLCPTSDDPNDISALTPSHFLVGEGLLTVPEPDLTNIKYHHRWQRVQLVYQQFWRLWSSDYLNRLQQRPKWLRTNPNIYVQQLVIVMQDNLPPTKWMIGRVTQTFPGDDGLIRVALVKCSSGIVKRPIVKLCPLPFNDIANRSGEQQKF